MPVTLAPTNLSGARSGSGLDDQAVPVREQHGVDPLTRHQLGTPIKMLLYGEPEGATFLVPDALLGWLLLRARRAR